MKRKSAFPISKPRVVRRHSPETAGTYFIHSTVRTDTEEFDFAEMALRKPDKAALAAFRARAYAAFCRALLGPAPVVK